MRNTVFPFLFLFILPVAGCAWLSEVDERRRVEAAREDDRECRQAGYRWPGEAYVECRRARADVRQRELWREMQMTQRDTAIMDAGQERASNEYRPIRSENFRCEQAMDRDGDPYIACSELD